MTINSCPYCQSAHQDRTVIAKELVFSLLEEFSYAICKSCGSAYLINPPDDFSKYYTGYYSFSKSPGTFKGRLKAQLKKRVFQIAQRGLALEAGGIFTPVFRNPSSFVSRLFGPNLQVFLYAARNRQKARILDVGAGEGHFVQTLRDLGYRHVIGIDPFVQKQTEFVRRCTVFSVEEKNFDFILMNHSFEHVENPKEVLAKCRDLLAPDGTILIHLPNISSPEFLEYGGDWWGFHAPRHLSLPTKAGLQTLASSLGLEIVDAVYPSRADHYLYSKEYSLNIGDNNPRSNRFGFQNSIWSKKDLQHMRKKAYQLNREGRGDWVCYYLTIKGRSRPV